MSAEFDIVISGGTVYDGTGGEGVRADVGVRGERIGDVGDLVGAEAKERIDAAGMAVCPGFIDAHTHSDLASLLAPLAESRLYAGVTTEVGGNCGFAAGPFQDASQAQFLEMYEGLEVTWRTQGEFFERLEEAGSAVNHVFLAGHGNIRRTAMGGDHNRAATDEEVEAMRGLLREELEAGAVGMSTGLIYPPGCFAAKEEIAAVARVVGEKGGVYASHIRSEAEGLFEALEEAVYIAQRGGCALQVSHLKVYEKENWGEIGRLKEWWSRRGERGVRVTADRYPYTAGHTNLDTVLPQWVYEGGQKAEVARLRDDAEWSRIREELDAQSGGGQIWEQTIVGTTYSAGNKRYEGERLGEVAEEMGVEPAEAVRRLLVADEGRTAAIFFKMSEENMLEILSWDDVVVGSDSAVRAASGATAVGFPHPRAYGTTGRILRMLVREKGVMGLGEAVAKMTGRVAEIFGLAGRGRIERGCVADIVVFDAGGMADRATYEEPSVYTTGVRDVLVNGRAALRGGKVTGEKPGRVLRHGRG